MLRMAWVNLSRRPWRTSLTIAGIVVGTTAYITLVALSLGMREQSQQVVDLLGTDVTVTRGHSPVPWMSWISREEAAALRGVNHVKSVSEAVIGTTRIEPRVVFFVFGVSPDDVLLPDGVITAGRLFRRDAPEIVVGQAAARQLDVEVGDVIDLGRMELEVVGVYRTERGFLDSAAIVDLAVAQALFGARQQVSVAFLRVTDAGAVPKVIESIHRRFPRLEASRSELFTSRFDYLKIVSAYARYFAILALVIAALMIANTIGMNVSERVQEIAILRSVGWRPRRIAALIVGEGLLMIVIGVALSIPAAKLSLMALSSGDTSWAVPPALRMPPVLEGIAVAVGAGILFSIVPTMQALRRNPADALRAL